MTATLHLWRRLDWRFLMPEPLAGTLLVAGRPDKLLLEALPLLDAVTVVRESPPADTVCTGYLVDPRPADLAAAVAVLRPGGVLYAEVSRRSRRTSPAAWGRAARGLGLLDVRVHWHAPDFAARTRVVPLDDRAAVLDTLSRHDGVRAGALRAGLAGAVYRMGALGDVIGHGSVLGRRA